MSNLVWIEVGAIQSFVFQVPNLRIILGANALLGRFLQWTLPGLALNRDPNGVPGSKEWLDDLLSHGILSAAGGHFIAEVPDSDAADDLIKKAHEAARREVPGLVLRTYNIEIPSGTSWEKADEMLRQQRESTGAGEDIGERPPGFPYSRDCQFCGAEPGTQEQVVADTRRWIGPRCKAKFDHAELYYPVPASAEIARNRSTDALWQFQEEVLEGVDEGLTFTTDFEGVYEEPEHKQYLCLLFVDGNASGEQLRAFRDDLKASPENRELTWPEMQKKIEKGFWHRRRRRYAEALKAAIVSTYKDRAVKVQKGGGRAEAVIPCRPLIMGGDDLWLLCRAREAPTLLLRLAEAFHKEETGGSTTAGNKPLSFAAGMVFMPRTFPIWQAVELGEELLDSSKKNSENAQRGYSTVDWETISTSFVESLERLRRRDYTVQGLEDLQLTIRPYVILEKHAKGCGEGSSFEKLLTDAGRLRASGGEEGGFRSGLKQALFFLSQGPRQGAYALRNVLEKLPGDHVLRGYVKGDTFETMRAGLERIGDLVDLYETLERR